MGYEIKLFFHPRKETGGYDLSVKEETVIKVGKPFDDTPLERLAGVVMSQMARRDVFVIAEETQVVELVRTDISFKECKDGKGIVLKNKKFSFNEAAQLVAEDMGQPDAPVAPTIQFVPQAQYQHPHEAVAASAAVVPHGQYQHPHEALAASRQQSSIEDLYGNPSRPVPVARTSGGPRKPVNQKRVLYKVYLEPDSPYRNEIRRLPAKFSYDKDYPVHEVIPSPTGRLDAQRLAITDDTGKVVEVDEKYFTSAGVGLVEDHDHRFSGPKGRGKARQPKLAFEDEMYIDAPDPRSMGAIQHNIPVDDGSVPDHLMAMPNLRVSGQQRRAR
jgi:hypothetical protein